MKFKYCIGLFVVVMLFVSSGCGSDNDNSSGTGTSTNTNIISNDNTGNTDNTDNTSNTDDTGNDSGTTTLTNGDYEADEDGEHAVLVDGETKTITNSTVLKTGGPSSGGSDDYDFKGTNAAVLVQNGGVLTLTGSTIETNGRYANAVFSYGGGSGDGTHNRNCF